MLFIINGLCALVNSMLGRRVEDVGKCKYQFKQMLSS